MSSQLASRLVRSTIGRRRYCFSMQRGWLLFEVLGGQPVLIAQGERLRKFIPADVFLQRNAAQETILEIIKRAVDRAEPVRELLPGGRRAVHGVPVIMTDGVAHGVHIWTGPAAATPPPRALPGAIKWDLTTGMAADCPQALLNAGKDPAVEPTNGRSFAADMPVSTINSSEAGVLALAVNRNAGDTFCATWDLVDHRGQSIRAAFASRVRKEMQSSRAEHLVCRAMNWRVTAAPIRQADGDLARSIVRGTARHGAHRALLDLGTWHLLKWLDSPSPDFDWQRHDPSRPLIHPDDAPIVEAMSAGFAVGPASAVLRLRNRNGGWRAIHLTLQRLEIAPGTVVGLVTTRLAMRGGPSANPDQASDQ